MRRSGPRGEWTSRAEKEDRSAFDGREDHEVEGNQRSVRWSKGSRDRGESAERERHEGVRRIALTISAGKG